jgi:hypothetical protein
MPSQNTQTLSNVFEKTVPPSGLQNEKWSPNVMELRFLQAIQDFGDITFEPE